MTITLDGSSLTIEKLVRIARFGEEVELAPAVMWLMWKWIVRSLTTTTP